MPGDKLMPWRVARTVQALMTPWRASALAWQEYWRVWHAVWRPAPTGEPG